MPSFPGQHFLSDKRLAKRLVSLAESHREELVIDIGAGSGALTVPLAEHGWRVLAVESDPALVAKLRKRLDGRDNVRVLHKDFLRMFLPQDPFAVVSSIPFSITTPILSRLMEQPSSAFQGGVIVVERGAALRFTRMPITDPRILVWRTWFDLEMVQSIPARSFRPPPGIDAAVLRIERRNPAFVPPHAHARFMGLIASCLRPPHLPIARALRGIFTAEQIKRLARRLQVDRNLPVCQLTPAEWAVVYESMCRYVDQRRWPRPAGGKRQLRKSVEAAAKEPGGHQASQVW